MLLLCVRELKRQCTECCPTSAPYYIPYTCFQAPVRLNNLWERRSAIGAALVSENSLIYVYKTWKDTFHSTVTVHQCCGYLVRLCSQGFGNERQFLPRLAEFTATPQHLMRSFKKGNSGSWAWALCTKGLLTRKPLVTNFRLKTFDSVICRAFRRCDWKNNAYGYAQLSVRPI